MAGTLPLLVDMAKEAHEVPSGPPIKVEVNALILFQLLYVHYAAVTAGIRRYVSVSFRL